MRVKRVRAKERKGQERDRWGKGEGGALEAEGKQGSSKGEEGR